MDIKKKIELVATGVIDGFEPKNDMNRNFNDLGMDSLDVFGFVADVEEECSVSVPARLFDRIKNVGDVIMGVENLKKVKKTNSTWVPCRLNNTRQCGFMSNEAENARLRSDISPDANFCQRIACYLYAGKQK